MVKAIISGKEIDEKKASFKVLGISGTIKSAKRKFLTPSQAKD
jgi:RNase P/RNase MRP subunit POP5